MNGTNGSEPSVSVVMTAYNARDHIGSALSGIDTQTRPPEEVIVVDDGSTDGTADLVRNLFPKVRLLVQPNRGVAQARNAGIEAAQFEVVAFCDADDIWLPFKLSLQLQTVSALLSSGSLFSLLGAERLDVEDHDLRATAGRLSRLPRPGQVRLRGVSIEEILRGTRLVPSGSLVFRKLLLEIGSFDPQFRSGADDLDVWVRLAERGPVLVQEHPLFLYRITPGSMNADPTGTTDGIGRFFAKWSPETRPDLIDAGVHRRARVHHALMLAYRFGRVGDATPPSVFDLISTSDLKLSHLSERLGLRLAKHWPAIFSLIAKLFLKLRQARRRLRLGRALRMVSP